MPDNSIGAIWDREYQGKKYKYIKIKIDGREYEMTAYENTYKKEDKHPDWKIYIKKGTTRKDPPINEDEDVPF